MHSGYLDADHKKRGWRYPDDGTLLPALRTMLRERGLQLGSQCLERDRSVRASTFANEVVTVRLHDNSPLRLLCKYGQNKHSGHGHRRGLDYEIRIYRDLLDALGLTTPRFYGSHYDELTGDHWLAIEYIEGGETVNKGRQPDALVAAARLIGMGHARSLSLVRHVSAIDLITYEQAYFQSWAPRLRTFAQPIAEQYPWLDALCDGFLSYCERLVSFPRVLIHGEYTVHNILMRSAGHPPAQRTVGSETTTVQVAPIDWESAAVSFGEIDLAFLIDGWWPDDIQQLCIQEYVRHRYDGRAPGSFDEQLKAARLYTHFRWMGDRPDKTVLKERAYRFDRMRRLGQDLRII